MILSPLRYESGKAERRPYTLMGLRGTFPPPSSCSGKRRSRVGGEVKGLEKKDCSFVAERRKSSPFFSERMFGLFLHETYYPDEQRRSDDSRYRFSYPVAAGKE